MGELVTTTAVLHQSTSLSFVCLFVYNEAVVSDNSSDFVFLFLSTDAEYLVVDLNTDKVFGKDISVAQTDLCRSLRGQIMDH